MIAWSYEGGEFIPNENSKNYLYLNSHIERFLTVGSHDRNFFLLGPKGNGKTLLIRYKAFLFWNTFAHGLRGRASGLKTYQNELVENIQLELGSFTAKDINRFSETKTWRRLWKFSLMYYILSSYESEKISKELVQMVPNRNSVGAIATALLNTSNRGQLEKFYLYEAHLTNLLYEINYLAVHFIDRLDQNLGSFIAEEGSYGRGRYDESAVNLWVSAQVGLMQAIYDINSVNSHIKIYATIRSEAFVPSKFGDDLYQNINNYTTHLRYSKEELRIIFQKNIELMPKNDLVSPNATNPLERFLGFTTMQHRLAKDKDETPREEDAFDFIYRHTYGRPREIVRHGRALYDEVITKPEYGQNETSGRIEQVREIVNEIAYQQLFMPYVKELIPAFRQEEFDNFCKRVRCNAISEYEMAMLDQSDFVRYLYRIGLLGYVKATNGESGTQHFLAAGEYVFVKDTPLPKAPYYLTHPTIDRRFLAYLEIRPFYCRYNIIGDSYPFAYLKDDQHQPLDENFYLPAKIVSEQRWKSPGECFQDPIKTYYEAFLTVQSSGFNEHIEVQFQRLIKGLLTLGRYVLAQKLVQINPVQAYLDNLKFQEREVRTSGLRHEYAEDVGKVTDVQAHERFATKNFGRNLTAGATLFLNLSCPHIHCFLTNPELNFAQHELTADSCFRYLRKCFYLEGLTQNAYQDISQKNILYASLSPGEKEMLSHFRREYIQEIRTATFINKKDKIRLEKEFIERIFLPANF